MRRSISLAGKSESTLTNYARCLAHMGFHFQQDLLSLDDESILDYLHHLKKKHQTPSASFFKHTVYGLRFLFRLYNLKESRVILPSIEQPKKLPVVLSEQEVKRLLEAPKLLKHRLIIGLLYGCGLRNFELGKLKITDVNLERLQLHVQQGKNRKDRYLPLCSMLARGIRSYIEAVQPVTYLFNGNNPSGEPVPLSTRGVQWAIKEARQKAGIKKQVTAHTLRHSYATHLLEMGLDIFSLKDLLGHQSIQTTLVYLHVSQSKRVQVFSPLEKLYPQGGERA
jgi:site-specific recombinase XerD